MEFLVALKLCTVWTLYRWASWGQNVPPSSAAVGEGGGGAFPWGDTEAHEGEDSKAGWRS